MTVFAFQEITVSVKDRFIDVVRAHDCTAMQEMLTIYGPVLTRIRDNNGMTPLCIAAATCSLETAVVLLDGGADVDGCDRDGWTPLHWATQQREARLTALFLLRGAEPDITTGGTYMTPRQRAHTADRPELIAAFTEHDARKQRALQAEIAACEKVVVEKHLAHIRHVPSVKIVFKKRSP